MITRLEVDGFKSLQGFAVAIERVVRSSGAERLIAKGERLGVRAGEGPWVFIESNSGNVNHLPSGLAAAQWIRLDLTHLAGPSDRVDTGTLRPDGSNLPTVLADLPPPLVGEIRADLVALVPGLASFSVVPDKDSFEIEFELSGGETVPARLISDGTLRVLALLTAQRLDPQPSLIGIEEPENGIYPGRLRALVELLRGQAEEEAGVFTQVLLTTHSPVFLAALRNHPQHLATWTPSTEMPVV